MAHVYPTTRVTTVSYARVHASIPDSIHHSRTKAVARCDVSRPVKGTESSLEDLKSRVASEPGTSSPSSFAHRSHRIAIMVATPLAIALAIGLASDVRDS